MLTNDINVITCDNLSEKLKEIGITDSHIENIVKKEFDDKAAKFIFMAFNIAIKISDYFEPSEIAAITAGLKHPAPKKRKIALNKLIGLPEDSDSAEGAVCIAGILKNFIFTNNFDVIKEESEKYKNSKEATAKDSQSKENVSPDFEDVVKLVLSLKDNQKKALYHLLRTSID